MADFLAPFKLPVFTTEEYRAKKAKYVAEHGYSITFPQIGDIIHIGLNKPMTEQEKVLWYSGRKNEIHRVRLLELYKQKERSREKYNKMLASPIPNWVSNYTSVLTAWDNVQDVIISLAAIGRIAIKFLPRILARFFLGPIGLLWAIASIMSMLAAPTMCVLNPLSCKREMRRKMARRARMLRARHKAPEKGTRAWARLQKDKIKYGFKGYAKSGGFLPSFSEAIQALQVTKDIWGIGLAIGPIFGLAYDLMSGGVRWAIGQKVVFKNAPSDIEIYRKAKDKMNNYARWKRPKTKMTRSEFIAWKEKKIASGTWGIKNKQDLDVQYLIRRNQIARSWKTHTDWQYETALYCGADIAIQGMKNILDHWNPMENVEGLEHIEIEAYNEPNPLIEEMLKEEGLDPDQGIAWPQLGKRWATYEEIQTSLAPIAAENFEYFVENCWNPQLKEIGENSAIEFGLNSIAMLEGARSIEIKYHAALDIAETLLNNNYSVPLDITREQMDEFCLWMDTCEKNDIRPNLREILRYAKNALGFEFTTTRIPIEER